MKKQNTDKKISSFLVLLTLGLLLYGFSISDFVLKSNNDSLRDQVIYLFENYLDFILIFYVFICLQIAGYVELKFKQDYLMISIISILFTPFSIFFIIQSKGKDD